MYERPGGPPNTFDRAPSFPNRTRAIWPERRFVNGADLNEQVSIEERRNRRGLDMGARDGDRIVGGDIVLDTGTAVATMTSGRIYVKGDVRPVAAGTLTAIPLTGDFKIGVRLQTTLITSVGDVTLKGLMPGTDAFNEPGAEREEEVLVWAKEDDVQAGDFYPVYSVLEGTVLDQSPPPIMTGVISQIAVYDRDANGNYIVDGCEVTALGDVLGDQIFNIGAGTANIQGFKRVRQSAIRYARTEDPDLESIAAEVHNYDAATGAPSTVTVDRPPISNIVSVVIVKRATLEVVTRGGVPNTSDPLAHASVVAIESVVQGATTYVATTDYTLSSGNVNWSPGGAEPAGSSTYTVTYLYNDVATPSGITDTQFVVSGGVHDRPILVSYTSKLPRIDILCLDILGRPTYVAGNSARKNLTPPLTPANLLRLAQVVNNWLTKPDIINDGTHSIPYDLAVRYFKRLIDLLDTVDRLGLENKALQADPVARKGIFTDALADDSKRDLGATQTMAVYNGVGLLAIDQVLLVRVGTAIETMPFDEEIIISQLLATSGRKINPYANFTQMPGALELSPPTDFWTTQTSVWTSPLTAEFTAAPGKAPGSTTFDTTISERQEEEKFLRAITVNVTIRGFGAGEILDSLTIADVDVTPAGPPTANGSGVITTSFVIPALVPAGVALVRADGAAGSYAEARFVGAGIIEIATMRQVTLVTRAAPVPVPQTVAQQVSNSFNVFRTSGGHDPLAQTFATVEDRAIAGIDIKFAVVGNTAHGVRVQLATVELGLPTSEVLAEAFISMVGVSAGDIVEARFASPVVCSPDRQFAFVFLTDDNNHELAIARLGDVDPDTQTFVAAQPYTVGTLLSSSNRVTWTPEQNADLWFRIIAAKYTATTRTVALWTGAFANVSDILVRGGVDLPTADATFRYELVRASTLVIPLTPGQEYQFDEYVSETVTLRAVMGGTDKIAPSLYPGTTLIGGQCRTTGTYVTKAFAMGSPADITATFAAFLPSGATATVDVDKVDNTWVSAPFVSSPSLGSNWVEPKYKKTGFSTATGRVRITINGGAAARPRIAQVRAYSI